MSNPFVPRSLTPGDLTREIILDLWDFYQFMLSDEERFKQFHQWKTYDLLRRDDNENR